MRRKTFSICICLGLLIVSASFARAEEDFKITPDVIYGHKAGMALTFDVIQPKKPNGVGILFMMSGGWVSAWVPPQGFVDPKAPDGLKHFRDLWNTVTHYSSFATVARRNSKCPKRSPMSAARCATFVSMPRISKIDSDRLGVCGGSAGGHLSLMLGTASDDGDKRLQR